MDWISWVGTALSGIGAIIAIRQSQNAKSSAEAAKEATEQIFRSRRTSDLTALSEFLQKTQEILRRYTSGNISMLSGTSPSKDAEEIQSFLDAFAEVTHYFQESGDEFNEFLKMLNESAHGFTDATSTQQRQLKAREIASHLRVASSKIRNLREQNEFFQT